RARLPGGRGCPAGPVRWRRRGPTRALRLADGQDGDVVAEGPGGELAGGLEQRLAQDLGLDPGVAPYGAGDAVLPEELLAGPGLGQPVGVHEDQVARVQLDLAADV